jgi:uncharacterized protein YcbK (DUF882 family)
MHNKNRTNKKKIYNYEEFVLNEMKLQNAEEAIDIIKKQTTSDDKEKVIKEISKEYFSIELINGQRVLNLNDRNQDISVVQSILIGLGYLQNHNANGILDIDTLNATKAIVKEFNVTISIDNSIPLAFIKFLMEFEDKESEVEQTKSTATIPAKVPSIVAPVAGLTVQVPQSSVVKGENVKRGVDYPDTDAGLEKTIQYSLSKDGQKEFTPNFKVSEFACKDGADVILINPHIVEVLEKIRAHFGKSITINSAYRTPSYNNALRRKSKKVAKNSYHMRGLATDITISGVSPKEIYDYVNSFHQGGLGLYPTFVHVDVRDTVGDPKSRW